jgi:phosphoribosyl-dephospho-CoA transferase
MHCDVEEGRDVIFSTVCSNESAKHEDSVNETVEIVEKLEVSEGSGNEIESMETHAPSKLYKVITIVAEEHFPSHVSSCQ